MIHVIDIESEIILDVYFIDEETNTRIDYTIEEFLDDIRQ